MDLEIAVLQHLQAAAASVADCWINGHKGEKNPQACHWARILI